MNELKKKLTCRTSDDQLFPFPEEGRTVEETPPCFTWLPLPRGTLYQVSVYDGAGQLIYRKTTGDNYLVPEITLKPGNYSWDIRVGEENRGKMDFVIADHAVEIPRIPARELFDRIPGERPRELFSAREIPEILKHRERELRTLRNNILQAYRDGMPDPPEYRTASEIPEKREGKTPLPYREYFGRFRDYCDRNLVACGLGYALLGDREAGNFGVRLLRTILSWGVRPAMLQMGGAGDEVGLSLARCLPPVYDMLFPLFTEEEREKLGRLVHRYGEECLERLKKADYPGNPGNSHVGRIAAYLGEAAMVLKGTGIQAEEEALRWLSEALDVYGGFFPHYGPSDGGWAESTFYASSYTKWFLPFFSAVERYTGLSFLKRPFYQRYPQYLLHFADPKQENHPFGDGYWCHPEDPEWPGFFAQNPFRVYGERSSLPELKRLSEEAEENTELYLLHLLDVFLPIGITGMTPGSRSENTLTGAVENVRAFPESGYGSLHTGIRDPERDLHLLLRASPFGSGSHRHPDQGSFALFFRGIALISPSGYFGRQYGTEHHRHWLNTTKAHNTLLVDGKGQPEWSMEACGKLLYVREEGDRKTAAADLSAAYPELRSFLRTWTLRDNVLTVEDRVEARHPVMLTSCLHFLSCPRLEEGKVTVERKGVLLTVLPDEKAFSGLSLSDRFDVDLNEGVPEEFRVTMPPQYHLYCSTEKKESHVLKLTFLAEDCG